MCEIDPRAVTLAKAYKCPDCDSTTRLDVDAFGMHRRHVLHDVACPWLATREQP
ncbi:hypothetical protein QE367_000395 [Microbacterium paludicola]|uniref:Transposase n=1 Tax=Microbacterium paludicola TaxID=300019 RepID=A0ABU1HX11_9MICO|nr:hypothetical protein [Microbacterium paludicola]